MKEFKNISKKEMVSSGVRSLPDRPNAYSKYGAGALTAAQLKEAFDKLAELVAGRVNDIISSLKDGTFSDYVKPPDLLTEVGVDSLGELLEGLLTGEFANVMQVESGVSLKRKLAQLAENVAVDTNLQTMIENEETERAKQDQAVLALCTQAIQNVQQQMVNVVVNEQNERARKDTDLQTQINELKGGSESYSEGLAWFDVDGDGEDVIEHYVIITGIGSCTDTDIRIPPTINGWNVRVITGEAFAQNSNITSVVIPDTVREIGMLAFYNCANLKSVVIPDSVTYIDKSAFYLSGLEGTLTLNGVQTIGEFAFADTKITEVVLDSSVNVIEPGAFDNCYYLMTVICNSTTPPTIYDNSFMNTDIEEYRVLSTSLEAYKTANYWSVYADKMIPFDTLETLREDIDALKKNGGGGSANYDAQIADLQSQIDAEKANREAQDNAVLSAAAAAIQQNTVNLVAVIGDEQAVRANKDNDLQAQIDAINTTISGFVNVAEVGA